MKEEIFYGIKNAMDRGSTLEEAAQSFMNSGYNPEDVKEAVSLISRGAATMIQSAAPVKAQTFPIDSKTASPAVILAPGNRPIEKRGVSTALIVTLIIILLFLLAGLISFILFQDKIVSFLTG